jgi:hypothetical protein
MRSPFTPIQSIAGRSGMVADFVPSAASHASPLWLKRALKNS